MNVKEHMKYEHDCQSNTCEVCVKKADDGVSKEKVWKYFVNITSKFIDERHDMIRESKYNIF